MNRHVIENLAQQLRTAASGAVPPGNAELLNFQMHDGVAYSLTNEVSILLSQFAS